MNYLWIRSTTVSVLVVAAIAAGACTGTNSATNSLTTGQTVANATPPKTSGESVAIAPQATPGKGFSEKDIAKLKWIEGAWRGMDGDKPFYERYRIEGTAMIVESLADETGTTVDNAGDSGRFELKDGEFGKGEGEQRSAASEITDTYVQFVPAVAGKGNNFRFEKQAGGTWHAILEWPATADKPARQKIYKMEPLGKR